MKAGRASDAGVLVCVPSKHLADTNLSPSCIPPEAGRAWRWNSEASRGEQPDRGPHPQSSKHETLTLGRPNRTRWGVAFQKDGICLLSCLPATPAILFGIFLTFFSLYKSEEQGTRESCSLVSRQQSSHPTCTCRTPA